MLTQKVLKDNIAGMYLYGSALIGGLQRYSDLDLFVVTNNKILNHDKFQLIEGLLKISGLYMKDDNLPIELTIVAQSEVKPWRYPPNFEFQYGEWLREEFESSNTKSLNNSKMPELAILITQILLSSITLIGKPPDQVFCPVPYLDVVSTIASKSDGLIAELYSDTRNVLLTFARNWILLETDTIHSKPEAASWAFDRLPIRLRPVMERAREICIGAKKEYWGDIQPLVKACAEFIELEISNKIIEITAFHNFNKSIKIL